MGEKAPCVGACLAMQCTACALYTAHGFSGRWLHRPALGALLRRRGIALHYVSAAYWRAGVPLFVAGHCRLPLPLAAAAAQPCVPTAHCPAWQAPVLSAPRRHQGRA
jgi:hypothetical protein